MRIPRPIPLMNTRVHAKEVMQLFFCVSRHPKCSAGRQDLQVMPIAVRQAKRSSARSHTGAQQLKYNAAFELFLCCTFHVFTGQVAFRMPDEEYRELAIDFIRLLNALLGGFTLSRAYYRCEVALRVGALVARTGTEVDAGQDNAGCRMGISTAILQTFDYRAFGEIYQMLLSEFLQTLEDEEAETTRLRRNRKHSKRAMLASMKVCEGEYGYGFCLWMSLVICVCGCGCGCGCVVGCLEVKMGEEYRDV